MASDSQPASGPKIMCWTGCVISVLVAAMLIMSAVMKFTQGKDIVEGFEHLGYPLKLAYPLGILELTCVVVYLIPRTSVLGAILLTGYLGGATATHVRLEENFVMPIVLGVLAWLALFLRDARIRALIPVKR